MPAVWTRVRAELRRRLAATIWLMLFLGISGGAVLGALTGARRTDTAYPRMLEATSANNVLISVERTGLAGFYDEVGRLDAVADFGPVAGVDLFIDPASLPPAIVDRDEDLPILQGFVAADDRAFSTFARPVITTGRAPRPDRSGEVLANRFLVDEGVGLGDTLVAGRATFDPETEEAIPFGDPIELTIVGVGVFPWQVVPVAVNDASPAIVLTPAFFEGYLEPTTSGFTEEGVLAFDAVLVRLKPGAGINAFRSDVERLIARHEETTGQMFFLDETERNPIVQRAIRPQVVALQLFGAMTAAISVMLVAQAIARQLYGDASDYMTLRALGMTRRQLFGVGLIRTATVAFGGTAIAIVIAIALSPLLPIGPARIAEPDKGVYIDTGLLSLGGVGIILALLAAVAIPALQHAKGRDQMAASEPSTGGPSRISRLLMSIGATATMTTGVRMAFGRGRGSTAAPVRSATIGTVLALIALAATVTFGSSLDRLIETPRLYGQTWDLTIDAGFGTFPLGPSSSATNRLSASPDVESFAAGIHTETTIEGIPVASILVDQLEGNVAPTMLEGRPPLTRDEIAIGTQTLDELGRKLGDTVSVSLEGGDPVRMRIVGRPVFPLFGEGSFATTGLGVGAMTTTQVLPPPIDGYSFFLINVRHNGSIERVQDLVFADIPQCEQGFCFAQRTIRPGDVTSYERVRGTPLVLAGLLSLLAAAAIAHALITSVRRRGRDFAILKSVGFVRRQVSATVAWQASTMMLIALAAGIPAGIAAGRSIWNGFAGRLGVPSEPIVPMIVIGFGVVGALIVANIAAAWPGARAARLKPATVLRDE